MTTQDIIITTLIITQLATCTLSVYVYRKLNLKFMDLEERIDWVLEALEDLKDFLSNCEFEIDSKIDKIKEGLDDKDDDVDWWKKG